MRGPSCICKILIVYIFNELCLIQHAWPHNLSHALGNDSTHAVLTKLLLKKIFLHCWSQSLANFEHTPRNSNDISQSPVRSSPLTFLSGKLSFFAPSMSTVLDDSAVIIGKSKGQSISALCKWPHYIIWSISESKWHSIRGKKKKRNAKQ